MVTVICAYEHIYVSFQVPVDKIQDRKLNLRLNLQRIFLEPLLYIYYTKNGVCK